MGMAGATIMGDGRVVLILDVASLFDGKRLRRPGPAGRGPGGLSGWARLPTASARRSRRRAGGRDARGDAAAPRARGGGGVRVPGGRRPARRGAAPSRCPPSGLAADILALAGAAAVPAPAARASRPRAGRPPPVEAAPRAHNISFFAAPVREERKAAEATEHLATFFLGREEYGVDVRLVQEIIRVTEITQVPRAPEFIKGVINLRGRIIPVVDLRKKLGLGEVDDRAGVADRRGEDQGAPGRAPRGRGLAGPEGARLHHRGGSGRGDGDRRHRHPRAWPSCRGG